MASGKETAATAESDSAINSGLFQDDVEKTSLAEASDLPEEEKDSTDPNIVDWEGPDDPENPMNWPSAKKFAGIGIVSLCTFLSPLASTIISSSTADVLEEFNSTSETLGAFITSVFLLGYTFGPLVVAPLSELYGRSIVYHVCNFLFLIFNIACALSNSLNSLIVFRLFVGIASSCPLTIGAGTISDMVPVERRGAAMAGWVMGPVVGPTFGPLIGAYLAKEKGWRWVFWLVSIIGGFVFLFTLAFLRESYAPTILNRKTKRKQKETGNPSLKSALATDTKPLPLFKESIFRPVQMLIFSPMVLLISLYLGTIYSYLYLLFTTFPRVYIGQYLFSTETVGLVYLGTGIGSFIGLFVCGIVSDRIVTALAKKHGRGPIPEYRLPITVVGACIIPAGIFMYGWCAEKKVHWIAPIMGTFVLGFGMFIVFMPMMAYLVDAYTRYAASVSAASTVLRSLIGALLPLAGNAMYDSLGVGWGTSVLGFIAVAFIPVPLVFWKFGERIRGSGFMASV